MTNNELTFAERNNNQEEFLALLEKAFDIHTEDETLQDRLAQYVALTEFLCSSDFFEAPASTKFHLSVKGGLCKHSLDVYHMLMNLVPMATNENISYSTIIKVALLHDICKANFYKTEMKNVKVNGSWTTQPIYVVNDKMPLGHGEKSVILLLKLGIKLTDEEIYAIRWHMNGFDCAVKGGEFAMSNAQEKTSLVTLLQCADLLASQVLEKDI